MVPRTFKEGRRQLDEKEIRYNEAVHIIVHYLSYVQSEIKATVRGRAHTLTKELSRFQMGQRRCQGYGVKLSVCSTTVSTGST